MPYKICNFMNAENNLLAGRIKVYWQRQIGRLWKWQRCLSETAAVQLYSIFHDYDRMVPKM